MRHKISDPNDETRTGTCAVCGPGTAIRRKGYHPVSNNPKWICLSTMQGERMEAKRARQWKHKYGITPRQYAALLSRQGGHCALCDKTPEQQGRLLAVDHDHATGRVRGLLCARCNGALGHLGDSEENLLRVLAYLRNRDTLI